MTLDLDPNGAERKMTEARSLREYFKPVTVRSNTDTYLEIGHRRWEGWPATWLAIIILCGPLYVALAAIVLIRLLAAGSTP
jgi:hypothetical protein